MNILLWVLQVVLAFFCLSGGGWKLLNRGKLPKYLPGVVWVLLGALEVFCAVGLIIPTATPWAAVILVWESLFLTVLYGSKSIKFSKANPYVYALSQLILAVLVGFGRLH